MAIELDRVAKVFTDTSPPLAAVGPISLSVNPGEFVAVVGPSGCGKSTLLRLVADLAAPTSGAIRVGGRTPSEARRIRTYGIVFQAPVLFAWRTVEDNVALPLEIAGETRRERARRSMGSLELVGMTEFAKRYPHQLSGGMQQRVAIARALSARPQLLLMDEPFGALDEISRERMNLELLRLWTGSGLTVLFVTHSVDEAVFLGDRVIVLGPRPGQVVHDVHVRVPRPRTPESRLDPAYLSTADAVRRALRATWQGA